MHHARIVDGFVVEVLDLPDDVQISDAVHPTIAPTFVPVDGDVREGWAFDGEVFSAPPARAAPPLQAVKASLKGVIDYQAELERLKYITAGAGQTMTYLQKIEEVRAFAQDAEPVVENYPLLSSEIGITAPTLAGVAAIVLEAYQQWQVIGAEIERVRLGTKAAIDAAGNMADAQAAASSAVWPAS